MSKVLHKFFFFYSFISSVGNGFEDIKKQLKNIKGAVVCIAYQDRKTKEKIFLGTGFFIETGFIISGREILSRSEYFAAIRGQEYKTDYEIVAFHSNPYRLNHEPNLIEFRDIKASFPHTRSKFSPVAEDYGHIAIFVPKITDHTPLLHIRDSSDVKIFDKIIVCGYPSGRQTMDLIPKYKGIRFSPVIQFGLITGFMPTDETPVPYGMQTDVVSGVGSIGSPIINIDDGKVIGISVGLIQTDIMGYIYYKYSKEGNKQIKTLKFEGKAEFGLLHGIMLEQYKNYFWGIKSDIENDIPIHPIHYVKHSEVELNNIRISTEKNV